MHVAAAPRSARTIPGARVACPRCGFDAEAAWYPHGCPACRERGRQGGLVLRYDRLGQLPPSAPHADGVWAYGDLLPAVPAEHRRTIGEGSTPLVQAPALAELTGNGRIWLKLEMCNPTAAHKDRFHAVSLAAGRALGYDAVVSQSTGNHGFSMASYAAAHGMRAVVIGNPRMPPLIQRAIRFVGGLPLLVDDGTGDAVMERLIDAGWFASTGSWPLPISSPFGIEGYKTIGYEIYQALGERMPDVICAPSAGGDGVVGIARAMADLRAIGKPHADARLCPCQPANAAPIVAALERGLEVMEVLPNAYSRALSIGDPIGGSLALEAVRRSGGFGVRVTDDEILAAGRLLAANGLLVEPSSAASVAGAIKINRERPEERERSFVCVITSSGLKWLDDYSEEPLPGGVAAPDADTAMRQVERFAAA